MDTDIEEKRQNAIEQVRDYNYILLILLNYTSHIDDFLTHTFFCLPIKFFTKGAIVPSPWAAPNTRKGLPMYTKSRFIIDFNCTKSFYDLIPVFALGLVYYKNDVQFTVLCLLVGSKSAMIEEEPEKISGLFLL